MNLIEQFEKLNAPGPIPTSISRPFWDAATQKKFVLQRCKQCREWVFYPRGHCPHCWGGDLAWEFASGSGRLRSFSVVHRPGHPAWKSIAPYALGIVELDEGPTMLSTLPVENAGALRVGMHVEVRFVRVGNFTLPMFSPVASEGVAI